MSARLDEDPQRALSALGEASAAVAHTSPESYTLALDAAGIELGAGRPRAALAVLEPVLGDDRDIMPGQVLLLAGLATRATGDESRAERLLAGVRPGDPAFAEARIALGELSLARGDAERALRYLEAEDVGPRAAAGRWRAQRLLGADGIARQILADMERDDSGGLALLEVRRLLREAAEEESVRMAGDAGVASADAVAARPTISGRYTLQLGAWSDRSRALDMVRRYAGEIDDLRIDEARDERGQILYKVRAGAYDNPALARTEAARLESRLGLDIFVADRKN
ncbi:hypothetical protein DRQ50_06920 [bacterium]|nr:MAG: hypothetical protein DRQ50_06920 [bacterium]